MGKNALCCWSSEVFPSCSYIDLFILGALFPKVAKTPLQPICNPRAALPGAGEPGSALGIHRASLPSWAAACGALGDFPHSSVRLEIPPVVLGSSVCPLAAAVSLCFTSDSSSDQPGQVLLPVFDPSCKCCLYLHPGFLTLPLASQHAFYSPFGSLVLGFLAQNVIIPV